MMKHKLTWWRSARGSGCRGRSGSRGRGRRRGHFLGRYPLRRGLRGTGRRIRDGLEPADGHDLRYDVVLLLDFLDYFLLLDHFLLLRESEVRGCYERGLRRYHRWPARWSTNWSWLSRFRRVRLLGWAGSRCRWPQLVARKFRVAVSVSVAPRVEVLLRLDWRRK